MWMKYLFCDPLPGTTYRHLERPRIFPDILPEFDNTDELCFVRIAAMHAQEIRSTEVIFDTILEHLKKDGPRHTYDTKESAGNIDTLMKWSLTCATVKSLMLRSDFAPFEESDAGNAEYATWKSLCIRVWSASINPDELKNELVDVVSFGSRPFLVALLGTVAYERHRWNILDMLVSPSFEIPPAPGAVLFYRFNYEWLSRHVRNGDRSVVSELRFWTHVLQTPGWLPAKLSRKTEGAIGGLLRMHDNWKDEVATDMDAFLATLQSRGLFPVFGHVAVFVCGKATTIDQIRRLCARFPLEEIIARHTGLDWFGTMTTGVAEWDHSKPDRLEVMQMILEAGVDPNIKKARADQVLARCWWTGDKTASDGPLHQAAERGDVEMVELLLRYGAKNTLADLHGLSPSERARMAGHNSVASMIEAWVPHEEAPEVWASSYVADGDVTFE